MAETLAQRWAAPFSWRVRVRLAAAFRAGLAAEHGRFLPWLAVFMGLGNSLFFAAPAMPPAWVGVSALAFALVTLAAAWAHLYGRAAAWCLLAAALGFAAASLRTHALPPLADLPRGAVTVQGIVSAVDPLPQGRRVLLSAVTLGNGTVMPRRLRVRLRNTDLQWLAPGDRIRLRALLRPPYPPSYPGGWDQRRDAFFQGLGGVGFALGPVERLSASHSHGLTARFQILREALAARILVAIPGTAGAVAATLMTGIRSAMPYADRDAFSVSGLSHILAVAGLHIGIVMTTVFAACRLALAHWSWAALRWPVKEIATLAALAVGGFYMLMTGMHLPILRSFVMAALVTLGLLAGRRAISMRSLALAAGVLLLVQPEALAGVSFQMSFAAVMVLIAGYDLLREERLAQLTHRPGVVGFLLQDFILVTVTSILAALATAPFVAYHFGHLELYSIPANMLAVPITAFWVLPCGLAAYALMPLHLEALALVPMGWGCAAILGIARGAAALPAADLAMGRMAPACLALVAIGMIWLCLWQSARCLLGLLPLAAGLALPVILGASPQVLVSADFRMIALQAPGVVFVDAQRPDPFTLGEWGRFWNGRPFRPLPAPGRAESGAVCTADGCLLPGGVLLWRALAPPAQCRGVALILAKAGWVFQPEAGCRGVPVIDRAAVRAEGATAAWVEGGRVRILTDRASRGVWPWLPPPSG
ncbi:MAG TPA: ComEC/Rec2 family competence protein [Acidisoma sp.]|uniref:ComEC/Rec2 family competence protein n=1 Tax=Acidisoma sp. TaxID=1872115 RepID=UPI002B7FB455|nr:ComEC/Rec2 family competence protein [Acidisoma sp.]HTI01944.1 ComEC/Rec2 family competence protein [Acidisoma sp.]